MADEIVVSREQQGEFMNLLSWYAHGHWAAFMQDVLCLNLEPHQRKIVEMVQEHGRVEARTCHGAGKTYTAGALVLTVQALHPYATTFTTAPTHRQVETLLWAEIGRRFNSSLLPELGYPSPMTQNWKIAKGWAAYGASSDQAVNVEGYHSPTMMFVVVDEAKGVDDKIFEALEGTMNAPVNKQLRISTPGPAYGEHYECSLGKKREKWSHLHISAPEIDRLKQWAEERKAEWGEDSPVYRMRVLGEYCDENSMKVFDARALRLFSENATRVKSEGKRIMGVDVARLGNDATVFTYRQGDFLQGQEQFKGRRTDEVADLVAERIKSRKIDLVIVDAIGYGGGVLDNLARMGFESKVEPFHANNSAFDPLYYNRKVETAFKIRKRMESGEIGGVLTGDLKHDLESYDYLPTNKDQLRMYDPEGDGQSPDFGDSFLYAFSVDDSSGPAWAQSVDKQEEKLSNKVDELLFKSKAERTSILEGTANARFVETPRRRFFFTR